MTLPQLKTQLKTAGHRMTTVRNALLALFTKASVPLSVPELQERLLKKRLPVNKTTVYREIEFLERIGIIKPLFVSADKVKYELKGTGHHHHVVCRSCDTVEDIDSEALEKVIKRLEAKVKKQSNFTHIWHSVEFFGQCKSCTRAAS